LPDMPKPGWTPLGILTTTDPAAARARIEAAFAEAGTALAAAKLLRIDVKQLRRWRHRLGMPVATPQRRAGTAGDVWPDDDLFELE
jgi:hypothetical protein